MRRLVVSGIRALAPPEAEEREESDNENERVSAGVSADMQANAAFYDWRLRRGPSGGQQGEEPRRPRRSA